MLAQCRSPGDTVNNDNPAANPYLAGAGYLSALLVAWLGWQLSEQQLIVAAEGWGYALGIIGSTMMVLLLLYPARKRSRWLRGVGSIRHWFRWHMILGVLGPLLVVLHCNFSLGSLNSRVALFATLIVAFSGVIGRYLYAGIHNGLYGQRLAVDDLRGAAPPEAHTTNGAPVEMTAATTQVDAQLQALDARVVASGRAFLPALLMVLRVRWLGARARRVIRQSLDALQPSARTELLGHADTRIRGLRRVARLQVCERGFALWHVVHYPLFVVMVVAAIVHVVAVHAY